MWQLLQVRGSILQAMVIYMWFAMVAYSCRRIGVLDESTRAALAAVSGRSADQRLFPSDGLVGDAVGTTTTFQTATVLLVFWMKRFPIRMLSFTYNVNTSALH